MKTPREVLLARHQAANAKLDALRREFVAEFNGTAPKYEPVRNAGFLNQLWLELFWSSRKVWLGFVTTWMVLGLMHVVCLGTADSAMARAETDSPQMLALLREQNRLRVELTEALRSEPAAVSPFRPSPRSEANPVSLTV
ncbi:MAG: hypothetical protein WCO56_13525 [Verrucomicrobiota bacterium]